MVHSFPKIFTLGQTYIKDILDGEVEITEKIDGSQFVFGKIDNKLHIRSKGASLYVDSPEKMFSNGISFVSEKENILPDNTIFYCEYLRVARHNILHYKTVPKNHLILFGVYLSKSDTWISVYNELESYSKILDIDVVPLLHNGVFNIEKVDQLLKTESILGGADIEGFVVKNYKKAFLLGGQPIPLMAGKYVTENFKEKHKENWGKEHSSKGKWEIYKQSFKTEARWLKSIQRLKEVGKLECSPRDIGNLIKEIQNDVVEEYKEDIKEFLWKEFGGEIIRISTHGFPEFYKRYLLEQSVIET